MRLTIFHFPISLITEQNQIFFSLTGLVIFWVVPPLCHAPFPGQVSTKLAILMESPDTRWLAAKVTTFHSNVLFFSKYFFRF